MLKKSILTLTFVSSLISCGGGSGSNNDSSTISDPPTISGSSTISGNVADGYLRGAIVCADINNNKVCDDDEPRAETGEKGAYTLPATAANYPLIAEILATTVDEDTMEEIGSKTYTLATPKGQTFISPITTMAQNKIDSNPTLSADDAASLVKNDLGMSGDASVLYEDYASDTNASSDTHKKVYQTAQMIARVMAEIENLLEEKFEELGLILDDNVKKLIQQKVNAKIEELANTLFSAADSHISNGGSVDVDFAETAVGSQTASINQVDDEYTDADEVQRQIDNANRDTSDDTTQTAKEVVEAGAFVFNDFDIDEGDLYLQIFTTEQLIEAKYSTTTFNTEIKNLSEAELIERITSDAGETDTLTINTNGSVQFTDNKMGHIVKIFNISKQSLDGITLNCNEIVGYGNEDEDCPSEVTTQTITFAEGDYRYLLHGIDEPRFSFDDIDTLNTLSFNELCPTIANDNAYCRETDFPLPDILEDKDNRAGDHISYWSGPKFSFFLSNDGNNIEVCSYTDNYLSCTSEKRNIGEYYNATLTSGEKIWIYPSVDYGSNSIYSDIEYRITTKKDGKYYKAGAVIPAEGSVNLPWVYAPYNWNAYKKIVEKFGEYKNNNN